MNIRPVPMNDFIVYLEEQLFADKPAKFQHILDLMSNYYHMLNDDCPSIVPAGGDYITAWCNHNCEEETTEDFVAGMILYKENKDGICQYGIVFQPSYYVKDGTARPEDACVITLDSRGRLSPSNIDPDEWDGWGVPCRYFFYQNDALYKDIMEYNLGDRTLCVGMKGYDVEQLSALLRRKYPTLQQTLVFTPDVRVCVEDVQRQCGATVNGFVRFNSPEGQKVMRYLANEDIAETITE